MAQESTTSLDTILDLKRRDPFGPFTVVMTSGDRCLIEDPDALAVTSSQLHYFPPRSKKTHHLPMSQIALVEESSDRPDA